MKHPRNLIQMLGRLYDFIPGKKIEFGKFRMQFPVGHPFPRFFASFEKYDRFLPKLVRALSHDFEGGVVDVGANVGATLASLVQFEKHRKYMCIEADLSAFKHLTSNVSQLERECEKLETTCVQAFVGTASRRASRHSGVGTAHFVDHYGGAYESVSLDKLVAEHGFGKVSLLKIDTDGYDWDVIRSGWETISRDGPLIFMELQCDNDFQLREYLDTLTALSRAGYSDFVIFDNTGSVMVRAKNCDLVAQIFAWTAQKRIGGAHRSVPYIDLLLAKEVHKHIVDESLLTY